MSCFSYIYFSNELSLQDYLQMTGNFSPNYYGSACYSSGYFDQWNVSTVDLESEHVAQTVTVTRGSFVESSDNQWVLYDLLFRPPIGILNSTKPLMPKTEMTLHFDRATSELAMIAKTKNDENPLSGKAIELENVFLKARYISSPKLRNEFEAINERDILYNYDECSVFYKNLPQGMTNIRLNNIIGGNTPSYLFAGIIESAALMGDDKLSATKFGRHNLLEFDLTIDGYSVIGFPIRNDDGSPVHAYDNYLRTTNRAFNNSVSDVLPIGDYRSFHYLYGHAFSQSQADNGWIGINLKLEKEYTNNFTLGTRKFD